MNTTAKDKTIILSKKGLMKLKSDIALLELDRLKALDDLREVDKSLGHDERLERSEKLAVLEKINLELIDKKDIERRVQILPSKRDKIKVAIGSVVDLVDIGGRLFRYTIVDSLEADPSDGKISFLSPLGQNLIGRGVKDIVRWGTKKQANQFRLMKIT